jgi:prepilin-type processing-associated H-X9-DG protein
MIKRSGVSVVELFVTLAILAIAFGLLLPALQAAREAARRTTCKNHLKQLSQAMLQHEQAFYYFPSNGWSYNWVGEPGRGSGRRQPGSWAYSLLPRLGRADLHQLGAGQSDAARRAAANILVQSSLDVFNCPSRRAVGLSIYDPKFVPVNCDLISLVAKSDYAVNAGDDGYQAEAGPSSLAAGDDPTYPWPDNGRFTGISFQRSEVGFRQVSDGATYTYMLGEKYMSLEGAAGGLDPGDDQSMFAGFNYDVGRWSLPGMPPTRDSNAPGFWRFGSAHPKTCQFAFCDGSVREISFWIDDEVSRGFANRRDRKSVNDDQF